MKSKKYLAFCYDKETCNAYCNKNILNTNDKEEIVEWINECCCTNYEVMDISKNEFITKKFSKTV